jgi:hypothetical protein
MIVRATVIPPKIHPSILTPAAVTTHMVDEKKGLRMWLSSAPATAPGHMQSIAIITLVRRPSACASVSRPRALALHVTSQQPIFQRRGEVCAIGSYFLLARGLDCSQSELRCPTGSGSSTCLIISNGTVRTWCDLGCSFTYMEQRGTRPSQRPSTARKLHTQTILEVCTVAPCWWVYCLH